MLRRLAGGALAAMTVLAAYGCGSSGTDTSVGTDATDRVDARVPAADTVIANGMRTVTYRGVEFDVPADWPVYDLEADPSTCVRFDEHAVFLGEPGDEMRCPSTVVGRADALLLTPTRPDGSGTSDEHAADGVMASTDSGLEVQVASDPSDSALDASIPSAGVDVTLTYQDSDAAVQQILRSFRAAAR